MPSDDEPLPKDPRKGNIVWSIAAMAYCYSCPKQQQLIGNTPVEVAIDLNELGWAFCPALQLWICPECYHRVSPEHRIT